MPSKLAEHLSRGRFSFLRPDAEEIRRIVPGAERLLPEPQKIFLADEATTPLIGFPVFSSPQLAALEEALEDYLSAEEEAQFKLYNREPFDSRRYAARWDRYSSLLQQATENVCSSNYGQNFAGVFWLYHSLAISRFIKQIPKRLLRFDLRIGRDRGDDIKYRVFFKFIDRTITLIYDTSQRLAAAAEEEEESLFPTLLARMRDNVLIFTEDHISPDLIELASYFNGCLRIDGRALRRGIAALDTWHLQQIQVDALLRSAVGKILGEDPDRGGDRSLLSRFGYVSFLASHPAYNPSSLLDADQVQVWESLLAKLKEFEALHALRKMVVPVENDGDRLISRDRSVNSTWVGGPPVLNLSKATRPIDFMAPWVVDPLVERYGLVYDITEFSAVISQLGRAEKSAMDHAFRLMFRFQRRVNKLASSLRLRMEKYLGDGAFYSGRNARRLLVVAIFLQRSYQHFLELGLPFDRGLRIAINYSRYRLLPLESGNADETARYEFFGQGIVELSRLATGKASQEIDEFKTFLVGTGYPETTVNKFFAPLLRHESGLGSRLDESRRFYAYINQNGTLINEGIVATERFIARLGQFEQTYYAREQGRGYIAVKIEQEALGKLTIGIRKLGTCRLKGLDDTVVYELLDGAHWQPSELRPISGMDLMAALDHLFVRVASARQQAAAKAE